MAATELFCEISQAGRRLITGLVLTLFFAAPGYAGDYEDLPKAVDAFAADVATSLKGQSVAIVPFLPLGPAVREKHLGEITAELLATRLIKTGGLTVIERAQLNKVLEETKLSLLGLTDAGNATKVGQMLGADLVIVGSVSETGDMISVSVRAVRVETGEAMAAWEARFPASTTQLLSEKYVVKRSRADAGFRSLLIPGWGQSYNGDDTKAIVFLGVGAALVGATAFEFYQYGKITDEYRASKTTPEAVRNYDRRVEANRLAYALVGITGAFWAGNAVEAFISGNSVPKVNVEAALPDSGGAGMQLAYRF